MKKITKCFFYWEDTGKENAKGESIFYDTETKEYAVEKGYMHLVKPTEQDLKEVGIK